MFQPNGISLHVEDHGSGKLVVLLHGCSPLSRCVTDACRSEPLFSRAQVLTPAKRTEALFHRSRQTERTLRTPSRDAWREESGTG